MRSPFDIVKDSSIWQTRASYEGIMRKDPYLRIGVVKKAYMDPKISDIRYLVVVQDRNDLIEVGARYLRSFGGVFNYEDVVYRGYKFDDKPDPVRSFEAKAGDVVLVGFLNGEGREAVILGSLSHPARKPSLNPSNGPQYRSEFNGIETHINHLGEYRLTFKAQPKNIKKLEETPRGRLPAPEYDDKVGGSFFLLDKTGSIELNDSDKNGVQAIRIDKPKQILEIQSGKIRLTLTKKQEKIDVKCKLLNIVSDDKIDMKTKDFKLDASSSVKIRSPKVAIGKDGVELLDQLFKLVEALSTVTPISPVGPCTALKAAPQWSQVAQVQNKIKEITGSL